MKSLSVIKFGGSLTKSPSAQKKFLKEIAILFKKENIILIHGGAPSINLYLDKFAVKSKFIKGLRYTDEAAMEIVEAALSGNVNKTLVGKLIQNKIPAVGISGKDGKSLICSRDTKLGLVGIPLIADTKLIKLLVKNNFLPVISPISIDKKGYSLNVNADSFASFIASAFKADRLIFLTDTDGILDKKKKTIKVIKTKDIDILIKDETISAGMIPKIKACEDCIKKGVKEVWIVNGARGIKNLKGTMVKK